MKALHVQGQTRQIPPALDRVQAAQPKLAKAQDALDPAGGRFHQPFSLGVGVMSLGVSSLVCMRRVAGPRGRLLTRVFSGRELVEMAGSVGPPRVRQGPGRRERLSAAV